MPWCWLLAFLHWFASERQAARHAFLAHERSVGWSSIFIHALVESQANREEDDDPMASTTNYQQRNKQQQQRHHSSNLPNPYLRVSTTEQKNVDEIWNCSYS